MEVPVFVSASQILARLLTVDANDSGLNANTLQGYQASSFALASSLSGYLRTTGADVGATSQAQTFTNSIIATAGIRPPSDNAAYKLVTKADGSTAVITANTVGNSITVANIYSGYGTSNFFAGGGGNPSLSSATQNVGIGFDALVFLTTGNFNFGLGAQSLRLLTTGNNNIGIGTESLKVLLSGNQNIGIGNRALVNVSTGIQNVAIGSQALGNALGSGNVALGNYAGFAETGSNKLYITNTDSKALIKGDFSTNCLAFGFTDLTTGTAAAHLAPSTAARAPLRFQWGGTVPSSPNEGDVWPDGSDLKIRIGGVTKTFTLV